ncbi:MAG: oxidoreductase, partial [Nitrososphaerales archaeon]
MLDKLFSPLDLGPVTIKNRIQITPHEQQYFENGLPTDTLRNYYVERAKGGAGLLEVSQIYVKTPHGMRMANWEEDSARRFSLINSQEIVPGLRNLSSAGHE